MKISAKAEYACLAVLELALRDEQTGPIRATDIAEANDIPQRFLVQILLQLKGAGIVASTRGSAGGYRLSVPPKQISVWDVVQLMDGSQQPNPPPVAWFRRLADPASGLGGRQSHGTTTSAGHDVRRPGFPGATESRRDVLHLTCSQQWPRAGLVGPQTRFVFTSVRKIRTRVKDLYATWPI